MALVLGGTGEVGRELVRELVANPAFSRIIMVTRRELQLNSEKTEQKIVDFEKLDDHKEAFQDAQVCSGNGFCFCFYHLMEIFQNYGMFKNIQIEVAF